MTATESKTRTITLTGRRPVRIHEDEWPVIAHGAYRGCDIRVRSHADGRMIIYGTYMYDSTLCAEAGVVDTSADVVEAIRFVGATLTKAASEAGQDSGAHVSQAVRQCIAQLPAETL